MNFRGLSELSAKGARRRRGLCVLATGAAASVLGWPLTAAARPRAIRIVVPYAAGGGTDILARHLADALGKELQAPVIVDNRPGAGTNIGADYVAKAAPDGTTLLLGDMALSVNPSLFKHMPYNPARDLQPIATVATAPLVLIVNPRIKAANVKELVALARSAPGAVSFASAGLGSPPHIAGELFRTTIGADMTHVPYKGVGPALNDLIGGQVSMLFTGLSSALPQIQAGKVRALAVTGTQRVPGLPDVPTMAQAGFPDIDVTSWWGLFGPKGLSQEQVEKLSAAVKKALDASTLRSRLAAQSIDASYSSAAELGNRLAAETGRWAKVLRKADITPK